MSSPKPKPTTRFLRYELKFVLSLEEADEVASWAGEHLQPDAFASDGGAGYAISSLYLDSPELGIYHRAWDRAGTKFRIRRYGTEPVVWLERKRRRGNVVRKRRASWPFERLYRVLEGNRDLEDWPGRFQAEVRKRKLRPTLLVNYARSAWTGGGNVRLTIDREIDARVVTGAPNPFVADGELLSVSDKAVLELKYDTEMPEIFLGLLKQLDRESEGFSKYGRGIAASGLSVVEEEAATDA